MNRMILAITLLCACGSTETIPAQPPAATAQTVYVCPMHPEVTSTDSEAACSICGMDLVEQEDHAEHGH